jgi:hypothetical protein
MGFMRARDAKFPEHKETRTRVRKTGITGGRAKPSAEQARGQDGSDQTETSNDGIRQPGACCVRPGDCACMACVERATPLKLAV